MSKGKRIAKKTREGENPEEDLLRSRDYISYSQTKFNLTLGRHVYDAWMNRASERSLYAMYSHIGLNVCNTIEPPDFPKVSIALNPQGLLGPRTLPAGETAPAKAPITKKAAETRPFPEQYPDFLRTLLSVSKQRGSWSSVHNIVDIWEIKDLNISHDWNTLEAHQAAEEHLMNTQTLNQVYTQATAAFAHHTDLTTVYHNLIAGVYFSQFKFTQPDGKIEGPLPAIPIHNNMSSEERQAALDRLRARIAEINDRTMPTIEYFNQPILLFKSQGERMRPQQVVSLSPQFLYALRLPLKDLEGCKFQSSWFTPPDEKPTPVGLGTLSMHELEEHLYEVLVSDEIDKLQFQLDEYINSPPSTANTASTSGGFQPSRYILNQIRLQQAESPLLQRATRKTGLAHADAAALGPIPMEPLEDYGIILDEEDNDEDGANEDED